MYMAMLYMKDPLTKEISIEMPTSLYENADHFLSNDKHGPLAIMDDITQDDMKLISDEILKLCKKYDDPYSAYIFVLSKYGIMCPHPQNKRFYDGHKKSDVVLKNYKWYNCNMCSCAVINEDWF